MAMNLELQYQLGCQINSVDTRVNGKAYNMEEEQKQPVIVITASFDYSEDLVDAPVPSTEMTTEFRISL